MKAYNLSSDYHNLYSSVLERKNDLTVQCSQFENFIAEKIQKSVSHRTVRVTSSISTAIPLIKIKQARKPAQSFNNQQLQEMASSRATLFTENQNYIEPFNQKNERQLIQLRKQYNSQPTQQDLNPDTPKLDVQQVVKKPRILTGKSVTLPRQQLQTKIQTSRKFPQWLDQREDFNTLKKSKYFDLKYKVISVCEIESFKRDDDQKKLVAFYLIKLSFFKLMPFQMLLEIAGRLTVKFFDMGEFICKQGDYGDQLYIVYKGGVDQLFYSQLHVIINGVKKLSFIENAILGRNALDKNVPRNATLQASDSCQILMLHRYDYQEILSNIMKIEREKWVHFIQSLKLFKHFEESKIKKFCQELQGKFLSPFDNLYKAGDAVDNVYICKNGLLTKKVVVDMEQSNRWPIATQRWFSKVHSKTIEVEILYHPESLIGYQDITNTNSSLFRSETIDAKEDCFLLYISKTQFLEIFDSNDLTCFQDHHQSTNPHTFEDFIQRIIIQKQYHKNKIHLLEKAISSNITTSSQVESEAVKQIVNLQKAQKLNHIVLNAKMAFRKHIQQYKVLKSEKVGKISLSSQYQ